MVDDSNLPVRARGLESLEAAYAAWLELKVAHASALAKLADEKRRLEQQGSFLVGAVRAARELSHPPAAETETSGKPLEPADGALTRPPGEALGGFLHDAEHKLARALTDVDARLASEDASFRSALAETRAAVTEKIQGFLTRVRPSLTVRLRPVGSSRNILHVDRPGPDEAVLLFHLFARRIPSRYDYLFDDSTDDATQAFPSLYADEGVGVGDTRPEASAWRARLEASTEVFPAKGHVPVVIAKPGGGSDVFRLLARGPVLELEIAEGSGFRNILTREEAERFAGYLVGLKLAGRLDVEIRVE